MIYFKEVPGFPLYRIGDDGSLQTRLVPRSKGKVGDAWYPAAVFANKNGYWRTILRRDGKDHWLMVHRLVLDAFVGPCPDGMMACHNNGDPSDNRLPNLRWGTMKENQEDRIAHGTSNRGERHGCSKLTTSKVVAIRDKRACGESIRSLAKEYGLDKSTVSCIVSRKLWRHIP